MEESRTIGRGEIFYFDRDCGMLVLQGFGELKGSDLEL